MLSHSVSYMINNSSREACKILCACLLCRVCWPCVRLPSTKLTKELMKRRRKDLKLKEKSATNILCFWFFNIGFWILLCFLCRGIHTTLTLQWSRRCLWDIWVTFEDCRCYCVRHSVTPEYPMNVDSRNFLSHVFVKHNGFGFSSVRKTTYTQHCCPHIHKQTHIPTLGCHVLFFFFLKKRNIRKAHHTVRVFF